MLVSQAQPPSGLRPNTLRAYASFGEDVWEGCGKQAEFKAIIFALCFFHSAVCERRKFGPIGWNRQYPFTQGDLTVCITVSSNYLNESPKVKTTVGFPCSRPPAYPPGRGSPRRRWATTRTQLYPLPAYASTHIP